MTKTTNNQLNNWLDQFKVNTSQHRLNRLEDQILSKISQQAAPIFVPMGWKENICASIGICSIAAMVLFISHVAQPNEISTDYSSYAYNVEVLR